MLSSDYRYHNNPNYQRLTEAHPRFQFSTLANCGLILFVVPTTCFLSSLALPILIPTYFFIIGLMSIIFAVLVGFFATWFVIADCSQPEFELLLVTPQSNRAIFKSYWHAFFDQLERVIDYPVQTLGMWLAVPNIIMMVVWILMVAMSGMFAPVEINVWEWSFIKFMLFYLSILVAAIGSYRLFPMMGMILALLIQRVTLTILTFLTISAIISGLWIALALVVVNRWDQWMTPTVSNYDVALGLAIGLAATVYLLRGIMWMSLQRYLRALA